jgi:hypothetical protein
MLGLVVFDLDGTLAESKSAIDAEMAQLLGSLLGAVRVAIISGGAWPQFESQVLANLRNEASLSRLSILPTCGTRFYAYEGHWQQLYAEDFTAVEKTKIMNSIQQSIGSKRTHPQDWGSEVEDRGSQITYSALGQRAPLEEKKKWDPDFSKRRKIKAALDGLIPEFSVHLGGTTSVDITRHGIDKAYGIRKLRDILHVAIDKMIYVGDALFPGGNDFPAKQAGARSIEVRNPHETKRVIEAITACMEED